MKLIFIHGRAQEKFDEEALKLKWINDLKIGLQKSDLCLPKNVSIEFPYYAKTLVNLIEKTKEKSNNIENVRSSTELSLRELELELALTQIIKGIELSDSDKKESDLLLKERKSRAIQNWSIILKLARFLDEKTHLGKELLPILQDVFAYLANHTINKEINNLVCKAFNPDEECVVVGHSLGSVVSYLVLKNNPNFRVKELITIGSPLGIKSLESYLEGPKIMPKCIEKGWFNAFDKKDIVALYPLDENYFNIRPKIKNKDDVNNFTDNKHSIEGYLQDKEVAKRIYDALLG